MIRARIDNILDSPGQSRTAHGVDDGSQAIGERLGQMMVVIPDVTDGIFRNDSIVAGPADNDTVLGQVVEMESEDIGFTR